MRQWCKAHKFELLFGFVFLAQVITIYILNFTQIRNQADFDSSVGMAQVVEIWKQKTFLIQDWGYQTTVGWDIPLFLAVFIYGVTKNVFLSLGIANNIFILLYIWVFVDILRKNKVRPAYILVCLCLFFAPYTLGQLGYIPMVFTGTASYAMKLLIPLLLMDLFVRLDHGIPLLKSWWQLGLLLLFSVLSSISSGVFLLICGVLPFLFYLVIRALILNDMKQLLSMKTAVIGMEVGAFALGAVLAGMWELGNKSMSMSILPASKVADNALNCFVGFLELFGAFPSYHSPAILSVYGMIHLCSMVIAVVIVGVVIYYFVQIFKRNEKRPLVHMILSIIFVNACVFLVSDTTYSSATFEYRYHIISAVSSMMLVGIFLGDIRSRLNKLCWRVLITGLAVMTVAVSSVNFVQYIHSLQTSRIHEVNQIAERAKELDVELIIDIVGYPKEDNELYDGRLLRLCDFDIDVATLRAYNQGVTWGASEKYFENANHTGKIMVLIRTEQIGDLPDYIRSRLVERDEILGYKLFTAEKNMFDCSVKLPRKGKRTIDFPYSTGNAVCGEINEKGKLVPIETGGTVLCGADMEAVQGVYSAKLKYRQIKAQEARRGVVVGEFRVVSESGNIIANTDIISDQKSAEIPDIQVEESMEAVHYEVVTEPGSDILVRSMETYFK